MAAALVIAHGHPFPAATADDQSLQQGGAFRAGPAARRRRGLGVLGEGAEVLLELLPGDVAGMGVRDQHDPLLTGHVWRVTVRRSRPAASRSSAVDERAGVARVVQRSQDPPVVQRHPGQLALVRPACAPGPGTAGLVVERLDHGAGRAGPGEGGEQVPDRVLHAGVGVEDDLAGGVVDQPDRERHRQLAAAGLGELTAAEPGRMKCSSASLIVPLRPSRSRSLKWRGS